MPLDLAPLSSPDVEPGTRIAAAPLSPGPYVVLAWACQTLPGGDEQDAKLQLDPGQPSAQSVPVPTPLCSQSAAPVRWQGQLVAGVNVVTGSGKVPAGGQFRAVVLGFPLRAGGL